MLDAEPDLEVVGEAGYGDEAVALAAALRPDVVLMDLRMPGVDGVTATGRSSPGLPATRVVVLTTYDTDADILRAVEAGATGYLLKDTPRAELADAVRAAARGETVLAPAGRRAAGRPGAQAGAEDADPARGRGARPGRRGLTNAEIGRRLLHRRGHGEDPPAAHLRQAAASTTAPRRSPPRWPAASSAPTDPVPPSPASETPPPPE